MGTGPLKMNLMNAGESFPQNISKKHTKYRNARKFDDANYNASGLDIFAAKNRTKMIQKSIDSTIIYNI